MKTEEAVALAKEIWRVRFVTNDDHIRIGQFIEKVQRECTGPLIEALQQISELSDKCDGDYPTKVGYIARQAIAKYNI